MTGVIFEKSMTIDADGKLSSLKSAHESFYDLMVHKSLLYVTISYYRVCAAHIWWFFSLFPKMCALLEDQGEKIFPMQMVEKMSTFFSTTFVMNIRAFQYVCHKRQPEVIKHLSLEIQTPLIPICTTFVTSFESLPLSSDQLRHSWCGSTIASIRNIIQFLSRRNCYSKFWILIKS